MLTVRLLTKISSAMAGLFYTAHKLVDSYADKPISWFAVGCYYYLIGNNESARKFFGRASQVII